MESQSGKLFQKARDLIPGGVNSPVRACKAVGLDPPFIERASGCTLVDVDGKEYIDYVCSWGPMILGHADPDVIRAVQQAAQRGTSYGAPTRAEVELAERVVGLVPSMEMVRMVNSGTEATMSAVRLARGYTQRPMIVKFEGCYHGHGDSLLVSAGSGVATLGIPGSPGIPEEIARHTICLPFNDEEALEKAFERYGDQIAAVIVEPIPANMGVVLPQEGFLEALREQTRSEGALLIFDEVITGFRVGPGGAQGLYGIMPDLTCLGKIIGGGLPVGAYGGRRDIMSRMAPEGDIYQAGTLSGNPLAMAAGLETLKRLEDPSVYALLEKRGEMLFDGLRDAARSAGIPVTVNSVGSLGSMFFTAEPVIDFTSAAKASKEAFTSFYKAMLEEGIYLAPSPFEAWFVSLAHQESDIERTLEAAQAAFRSVE